MTLECILTLLATLSSSWLTCWLEGLMTVSLREVPTSEAFSPTLLAQVLAAAVKLVHPEESEAQVSLVSSLSCA